MLVAAAAAVHMDSTHPSSAGSTISPPPWHPAVPVATTHQHQPALFDPDLITAAAPSPVPPASRSPRRNHIHPAGASRRPSSRRRPRPSRKVPTTYISADPASFRRMVHQVTGAVDLPPPLAPQQHEATTLYRPAPSRASAAAAGSLPTLDTSALLLLGGDGSGSGRRTGPAASTEVDEAAGGGVGVGVGLGGGSGYGYGYGSSDCGGGGGGFFPTLESWDALLY